METGNAYSQAVRVGNEKKEEKQQKSVPSVLYWQL
jgi:hypothetical protein